MHYLHKLITDIVELRIVSSKLKKDLGLFEVFCISSGAMISSGLFILLAIAYTQAGPAMIISYALASLLVLPTIFAKAELVSAMPKTGGIFIFADRSMGPLIGNLTGFAAWMSLAFKTSFALLGMGIFLSIIVPDITLWEEKLFAVGCCIFFTIINIYGVKLTAKFQSLMVIILLASLTLYIGVGLFQIDLTHFTPFAPHGMNSVFTTAGMVFISYAGSTKIVSVAGEVKDPKRDLPLGLLSAWLVVSVIYVLTAFVTICAVHNTALLSETQMPISVGGRSLMGNFGFILMSFAAILAFVTTGNAGLLASSRTPMAMGHAGFLPQIFRRVSKNDTPWFSILFTSILMITFILFLDLEVFVKIASTLKLILFSLANLSLIFMRRAHSSQYSPSFKAPLYPYMQIVGIAAYGFLIYKMGNLTILTTCGFILFTLLLYVVFSRREVVKEYNIIDMINESTGIISATYLEKEELREILIDKDGVELAELEKVIHDSIVIDMEEDEDGYTYHDIYRQVAASLSQNLHLDEEQIYSKIKSREKKSHIIGRPGFALVFAPITGENRLKLALVRTHKHTKYSDKYPTSNTFFIVMASNDVKNSYLNLIMWLTEIAEKNVFEDMWLSANNEDELRNVVLSLWARRAQPRK